MNYERSRLDNASRIIALFLVQAVRSVNIFFLWSIFPILRDNYAFYLKIWEATQLPGEWIVSWAHVKVSFFKNCMSISYFSCKRLDISLYAAFNWVVSSLLLVAHLQRAVRTAQFQLKFSTKNISNNMVSKKIKNMWYSNAHMMHPLFTQFYYRSFSPYKEKGSCIWCSNQYSKLNKDSKLQIPKII